MKISISKRLFLGFLTAIITICAMLSFVGLTLIDKAIVARIQDKVKLDLRSGRDIYLEEVEKIRETVRLSALGLFARENNFDIEREKLSDQLSRIADREGLDILTLVGKNGEVICRFKAVYQASSTQLGRDLMNKVLTAKTAVAFTVVIEGEDLRKENPDLIRRAYTKIVPSTFLQMENANHINSGLVIIAAAGITDEKENLIGVLYGGKLLNNTSFLVDRIMKKVYENETYAGMDVGLATIFLSDIRISTTAKGQNHEKAIGTLVSSDVYDFVLEKGQALISRPFAVNTRYVTAYEPIRDMDGRIAGILSIGVLEDRFRKIERNAFWLFFLITLGGLGLSLLIVHFFIKTTMKPLQSLVYATKRLADGNLEERVHLDGSAPEIAALGGAFNGMAQSIWDRDSALRLKAQEEVMKSERLAMIGQLAAGVAHEINNPLGSILLFNRLVFNKCPADSPMRPNLERIEREVKRCQTIVQGLLEFARQREPKTESTNLNLLIDKTIGLFENQPLFHNIEISRQFFEELPEAIVDPLQIQQVFINIIMNSVDAMAGKGKISITTQFIQEKEKIEVKFTDTGMGMTKDVLLHIFEPFYTTKGVGRGTGLGLSISYGIIQRHGGTIEVFSQIGEGSQFVITLPSAKRR